MKQLFTLPTVRIPFDIYSVLYGTNFDALTTILITDFTSEISDTNEKLNTVKFTLRFAVNRPKVNIPTSPGIFLTTNSNRLSHNVTSIHVSTARTMLNSCGSVDIPVWLSTYRFCGEAEKNSNSSILELKKRISLHCIFTEVGNVKILTYDECRKI